jgi:hypothetical protein
MAFLADAEDGRSRVRAAVIETKAAPTGRPDARVDVGKGEDDVRDEEDEDRDEIDEDREEEADDRDEEANQKAALEEMTAEVCELGRYGAGKAAATSHRTLTSSKHSDRGRLLATSASPDP